MSMVQQHIAVEPVQEAALGRSAARLRGRRWAKVRAGSWPYLFLMPYFAVAAVFFIYPLIYATILAFYQTNGAISRTYVGIDNFLFILTDRDFHRALWNTCYFAVFSVCLQLPLALALAMLLNARGDRTKGLFRLAIFSPNLVGQVFVGVLFTMLFTPQYGLFNILVQELTGWGLQQQWLNDPRLVMPAVIIAALWLTTGFYMIYFLAALQNVDQSLVEAAKIDGAGPVHLFWNVTRPAIMPVATFVLVMSTIGSFQLFELPYTLLQNSGGYGPANSGMTVVGYLYNNGFENGDLGIAAAVGWLLTLIILAISLVQIRCSGTMRDE